MIKLKPEWLILLWFGGLAWGQESLTWAVNDAPPFHIYEGPYAGKGFCDLLIQDLRQRMPEYQHEVRRVPQARITKLRQQGAPVCFPCMIKKPDTDTTLYSDATNSYKPHQIITNPENYQKLADKYGEPISLEALLQDAVFTFGYPLGRKYGERLQPLIEQHSLPREDHLALTAGEVTRSVLRLVQVGRLDYNIDYRAVGRYFELLEQQPLRYLPIAENQDREIIGAVGCSNTGWGRRVIKDINRVLPELESDSAYRQSLRFWFGSAS
ncbi:hypothetical protein HMF8227_02652 [Saliniradius amylolyticus]|uniref:Solute-binding protein family 3/N-terminal domain-containing protein n=1 Tax=Saliniradius amylolyticus TaxID=2183582 RepID=A0A2S2E618_9ALTE|nr:TIGR02285 family protein [Saliniradius amylolyticus]AWL13104.1 hypothetical protein HMF8227_02652 [Saliniradius amylolyticus]